jgi:putative ABC transport system permease protein
MSRRKRMMEDLDQDIRDHLERETQDNIERGMSPEEAHYAALRKFGNVTRIKEETREVWSFVWLEQLLQDVRFGLRMLRKSPGFTLVAVLTLALGIGANTAIFSVVNAVLLRPLPYGNSSRLVWAWGNFERVHEAAVSPPDFVSYRSQNRSFERLSAYFVEGAEPENLSAGGHGEQVQGVMVSSGFFETLGARPLVGRTLSLADEEVTEPQAVVLSYHLWQQQFGGDPATVGRSVNFLGSVTVVGVMGPDF